MELCLSHHHNEQRTLKWKAVLSLANWGVQPTVDPFPGLLRDIQVSTPLLPLILAGTPFPTEPQGFSLPQCPTFASPVPHPTFPDLGGIQVPETVQKGMG